MLALVSVGLVGFVGGCVLGAFAMLRWVKVWLKRQKPSETEVVQSVLAHQRKSGKRR